MWGPAMTAVLKAEIRLLGKGPVDRTLYCRDMVHGGENAWRQLLGQGNHTGRTECHCLKAPVRNRMERH